MNKLILWGQVLCFPNERSENSMKINYTEFDNFENIFLEDSFVLEIIESPNEIKFLMEVVLTKIHPMYSTQNRMKCIATKMLR